MIFTIKVQLWILIILWWCWDGEFTMLSAIQAAANKVLCGEWPIQDLGWGSRWPRRWDKRSESAALHAWDKCTLRWIVMRRALGFGLAKPIDVPHLLQRCSADSMNPPTRLLPKKWRASSCACHTRVTITSLSFSFTLSTSKERQSFATATIDL